MKRFCIWLLLEYKRAVKILPFVLAEAMVLMGIISAIAFCAQKTADAEEKNSEKAVIALVAEKNQLLDMAVAYMEGMQSVESFCRFEQVTFEQGKRMLQSKEAIAMIVLPDTVIEGILDGTNQPAALYLPKEMSAAGKVFEALADSGIGMLQMAQAEIYTINDICVEYGRTDSISDMEYDINFFNINLAFGREDIFKMRNVSVTENLSFVSYYCSAGMVLYLLLAGLSFCTYFERTNAECERQLRLAGIPAAWQTAGKLFVVSFLLIVSCLIPFLLYAVLWKGGILNLYFSVPNILGVLLCILCTAVILLLLYRIAGSTKGALLLIGIISIVSCFLAGVFIPSVLLPAQIKTLAGFTPAVWMKQLWASWFQEGAFPKTAAWKTTGFSVAVFGLLCLCSDIPRFVGRRRSGNE